MKARTLGFIAGLAALAGCTAEQPQTMNITPEMITAANLEELSSKQQLHFMHQPKHRAVMDYKSKTGEYVFMDIFCIYRTPPLILEVCVSESPFYRTNPDNVAPRYCIYTADNEIFRQAAKEAENILDFFNFPEELRHVCNQ
ncbi:MAG: hypothetical protein V1734_01390 [Nanoarchaeota archaeon]